MRKFCYLYTFMIVVKFYHEIFKSCCKFSKEVVDSKVFTHYISL